MNAGYGYAYDECLGQNPFFQAIQETHSDLIDKATEEGWIICVPRLGTIEGATVTPEDILEHILVPNLDLPDTHFCTLTKHEVTIRDKAIVIKGGDAIGILFDETCYVEKCRKYKLWCIERPLNQCLSNRGRNDHVKESYVGLIRNVHDCMRLLWAQGCALGDVNKVIQKFLLEDCEYDDLETVRGKVMVLYEACMEVTDKSDDLGLAVETYMQHCVHHKVFRAVCNCTSRLDANFNKSTRNLAELQLRDLEVRGEFLEGISGAKHELSGMNKASTALGKVDCLRRTIHGLSSRTKLNSCLTADDLLKIFVLLVVQSNLSNWIGNLTYITRFRFSALNLSEESSFLITTLEAAIEYVKSGLVFDDACKIEDPPPVVNSLGGLFQCVKSGSLEAIRKVFDAKVKNVLVIDRTLLCHPLCTCKKCEAVAPFSVNSRDDSGKGSTVLHVACSFGHPHVVEYLLNKNVEIDARDYSEATALHCASLRGHQNALLLLLHANAQVDPKNCDGNTPLHLAANNGHENCVKALLYFAEQKGALIDVNEPNNIGDTPLHFAVKWGYANIAKILLQYGAKIDSTNKRNQKILDITHNDYLKKLLQSNLSPERNDQRIVSTLIHSNLGIKPKNSEQIKCTDLALKSIENNDLPLTCYYLGIPTPPTTQTNLDATESTCHPLCTCNDCIKALQQIEATSVIPSVSSEPLNTNTCNAAGFSPLHVAAKCGRTDILRLLLDSGALVNLKTYKNHSTPLHLACRSRQIQIVRELLKCGGCDVDVQDAKGNSPLHYACLSNDGRLVELLLSHGCNCGLRNGEGKTALQEAKSKMMFSIVAILKGKLEGGSSSESLSDLLSDYDCI